jgi:glycerol-3-phosphate dehydrogenase
MMSESALSSAAREAVLDRLERERFDCVVIGGGISGAGVARHAAQRGLSVALLEADDFAAGTSSRSSKLIHGGFRYLAMGDIGLVRKTALERKEIFRIAPHLAERRWVVVPARSRAGMMKMRAGVTTYEKLGAVEGEDLHRNWDVEQIAREEPALDRSVYPHACVYREYLTDDAHLVLANLRSAAALGAAPLNHASVDTIVCEGGRAVGVETACRLSGRRVHVRARCVINAAGPWVEPVRRLEDSQAQPLLHLSKGVHVVLPAERLPINNVVILKAADGRLIFVIRHGLCVYIGTTDTTHESGHQLWPEVGYHDVEYLLEPTGRCFSIDPIRPDEVIGAWAGLRPLIAQPGKPPTEISRRDEVLIGPAGVVTMAGGKLTGYRLMARETLEKAAEICQLELGLPPEDEAPLPGGDFDGDLTALEAGLVREFDVEPACAARLARLHGSEARELARGGTQPLVEGAPVLASEVDWAVGVTAAASLEDVIYRRLRTAFFVPGAREESVAPAAERMAALLGWDAERTRDEIEGVSARLATDLAFLAESRA